MTIEHKTLRQEVLSAIREMIRSGELKQGERVVEQDLAQQLGVSRGPIRESLRQLEQEGSVQYVTNRGCFVKEVSPQNILENDLMQTQLELMALELLGGALPDACLAKLEELVESMSANGTDRTLNDILEEDDRFHRTIIQTVPMERLYRVWSGISQNSVELLKRFEREQETLLFWHKKLHAELLAALKTKDMKVIRPAMMQHCITAVRFQSADHSLGYDLDNLLK